MQKIAVSLTEAAELTSISKYTISRQIKRGALRVVRIGRRLVIPIAELEKLLQSKDGPAGAVRVQEEQ